MTIVFVLAAFDLSGNPIGEPKRLAALPIRIGRNGLNDFVINHVVVSSFHARIEDIDGRLCITDLASKNGLRLASPGGLPKQVASMVPSDLQPAGFEFYLGLHVCVKLTFDQPRDEDQRNMSRFTGNIVGNAEAMARASEPPPLVSPSALAPPPPIGSPAPSFAPATAPQAGYGPPPIAAPSMPLGPGHGPPGADAFQVAQAFPNAPPVAPLPAHAGGRAATAALTGLDAEAMALLGLKELAASLVPGAALDSTGDIARFITKIHNTLDAFCRSFIPLREGHAQFTSSFDLQRAIRRSQQRSHAYLAVEDARTPEALAAALLNPKDRALDASQAVEGILADLMLHQLALLEGVMRGVHALLEELSPDNIAQQAGAGPLSLGKHRALWSKYCELHENVSEERQAFAVIFGPEFTAAYRQFRTGGGQR